MFFLITHDLTNIQNSYRKFSQIWKIILSCDSYQKYFIHDFHFELPCNQKSNSCKILKKKKNVHTRKQHLSILQTSFLQINFIGNEQDLKEFYICIVKMRVNFSQIYIRVFLAKTKYTMYFIKTEYQQNIIFKFSSVLFGPYFQCVQKNLISSVNQWILLIFCFFGELAL